MDRRVFLAAAPALAACTPSLGTFDTLAPRDQGTRRTLHDQAFGPEPRQRLDLYCPIQNQNRPLPVIVFFYGGSWRSGDKDDYNFLGAALAAQGFLVAIPNYRLVPEVRFPTFLEDCAAAVRWVGDNAGGFGGDPSRIVLMGHSAGAYNAIMLTLNALYLEAASFDASRICGAIGLAGPYDFLPFDVPATIDAFGQTLDLASTQPTSFARADAPPLWLGWGEADKTVGRRNIDALASAVRSRGGRVETRLYPDIDHVEILLALSRPFRGVAPVLADAIAFANAVTR